MLKFTLKAIAAFAIGLALAFPAVDYVYPHLEHHGSIAVLSYADTTNLMPALLTQVETTEMLKAGQVCYAAGTQGLDVATGQFAQVYAEHSNSSDAQPDRAAIHDYLAQRCAADL